MLGGGCLRALGMCSAGGRVSLTVSCEGPGLGHLLPTTCCSPAFQSKRAPHILILNNISIPIACRKGGPVKVTTDLHDAKSNSHVSVPTLLGRQKHLTPLTTSSSSKHFLPLASLTSPSQFPRDLEASHASVQCGHVPGLGLLSPV